MPRIATYYWVLVPILGVKKCEKHNQNTTNRLCKVEGVPYFESSVLKVTGPRLEGSRAETAML
jgi:hypothetical protein